MRTSLFALATVVGSTWGRAQAPVPGSATPARMMLLVDEPGDKRMFVNERLLVPTTGR
jgi:hypothetical protein